MMGIWIQSPFATKKKVVAAPLQNARQHMRVSDIVKIYDNYRGKARVTVGAERLRSLIAHLP